MGIRMSISISISIGIGTYGSCGVKNESRTNICIYYSFKMLLLDGVLKYRYLYFDKGTWSVTHEQSFSQECRVYPKALAPFRSVSDN